MIAILMNMMPKVDLGNLEVKNEESQVVIKLEILNQSNMDLNGLKVILEQFEYGILARKVMKIDTPTVKYQENPVSINVNKNSSDTAVIVMKLDEKINNWLQNNRQSLDKHTFTIKVSTKDDFLLYSIKGRYSTMFGIRADLEHKQLVNELTMLKERIEEILKTIPTEQQKEVIASIAGQLAQMFAQDYYPKVIDKNNRVYKLSLLELLKALELIYDANPINQLMVKRMSYDLKTRLTTALATNNELEGEVKALIKDAINIFDGYLK
jgi:hypothetical protein